MTAWEHSDTICTHELSVQRGQSKETLSCTRPALVGHDRCPYHLESEQHDVNLTEDIQSRLELLRDGKLTIDEEPLTFFDVTFETLYLADLDLSPLAGRELKLDLRYCTVKDIAKFHDLTIPFPIDLSNATADGVAFEGYSIGQLGLKNGEIGSKGISFKRSGGNHDIRAQGCSVGGTIRFTDGKFGIVDFSDADGGNVAIGNIEASILDIGGAKFQKKEVILKPQQINRIDARDIKCAKLKLTPNIHRSGNNEETTDGQTVSVFDITNGTVGQGVTIRDVTIERLLANEVTTPKIEMQNLEFVSGTTTPTEPAVEATRTEVDRLCFKDVILNKPISICDVEADLITVEGGRFAKLEIKDATIDTLSLDAQGDTFGVCGSQITEFICNGEITSGLVYRTDIVGTVTLTDITSHAFRFAEAELNGCTVTGEFGQLVLYESTISRQTHLSVGDTDAEHGSGSIFITGTSGESLSIFGNEAEDDDSTTAVSHVQLQDLDLTKELHVANFSHAEIGATNVDVTDLSIKGLSDSCRLKVEESSLDDLFLTGDISKIELHRTQASRLVTLKEAVVDQSIAFEEIRIDGKLRVESPEFKKLSLVNSTIKNADFEVKGEVVEIDDTQVTEATKFAEMDIDTLDIEKSHLPRLDLTSESSVPVANDITLKSADLPNARLQANNGDLVKGKFEARGTTLREAEMNGFSAGDGVAFTRSNLTDAELRDAELDGADLRNALLSRTNLSEANLLWANLYGAVFGDAQITDGTKFVAGDRGHIIQDPDRLDTIGEQELATTVFDSLPDPDPKQAKTIYGRIKSLAMASRHSKLARQMHRQEKRMGLKTENVGLLRRPTLKLWYRVTGYEIGPQNVIAFGGILIFVFGALFALVAALSGVHSAGEALVNGMMFSVGVFFNIDSNFYTLTAVTQYFVPLLAGLGAIFVAALLYTIGQRSSL